MLMLLMLPIPDWSRKLVEGYMFVLQRHGSSRRLSIRMVEDSTEGNGHWCGLSREPIRGDCDDRHLDFHRMELDRLLDARRAKDTPPETVAKVQSSE
jgi:hypothetical protein